MTTDSPQPQQEAPDVIYIRSQYASDVMGGVYHLEVNECDMIKYVRADLSRAVTDDKAIQQALRPIRGCATDDQYVDVFERVTALVATTPRATAEAELPVESALKELREMFPDVEIHLTVNTRGTSWRIWLGMRGGNQYGSSLDDAMNQVRAWSKSRAATSEGEGNENSHTVLD
jgi:hypothetical protein